MKLKKTALERCGYLLGSYLLIGLMVASCSGGGSSSSSDVGGRDPGGGEPEPGNPDQPDRPSEVIRLQRYAAWDENGSSYFSPAARGPRYVALVVTNISNKLSLAPIPLALKFEDAKKNMGGYVLETDSRFYQGQRACEGLAESEAVFGLAAKTECLILVRLNDVSATEINLNLGETVATKLLLAAGEEVLDAIEINARKLSYMGGAFTKIITTAPAEIPLSPVLLNTPAGLIAWEQEGLWVNEGAGVSPGPNITLDDQVLRVLTTNLAGNMYGVYTTLHKAQDSFADEYTSDLWRWNGQSWLQLATKVEGGIHALASDEEGRLYIGGGFTEIEGQQFAYLARYTPTATAAGRWEAVSGAVFGPSLRTICDNDLYPCEAGETAPIKGVSLPPAITALTYVSPTEFPDHPYQGQLLIGGQFTQVSLSGGNPQSVLGAARYHVGAQAWDVFTIPQGFCSTHKSEILTFLPTKNGDTFLGGHFWVEDSRGGGNYPQRCDERLLIEDPNDSQRNGRELPQTGFPDLTMTHLAVVLKDNAMSSATIPPQRATGGILAASSFEGIGLQNPTNDGLSRASGVFDMIERVEAGQTLYYVAGGFLYHTPSLGNREGEPPTSCDGWAGLTYNKLGSLFTVRASVGGEKPENCANAFVADRVVNDCTEDDCTINLAEGRYFTEAVLSVADGMGIAVDSWAYEQQPGAGRNLFLGGAFFNHLSRISGVMRPSLWNLFSPLIFEDLFLATRACNSGSACGVARLTPPQAEVPAGGVAFPAKLLAIPALREYGAGSYVDVPNDVVWQVIPWVGITEVK